MNDWTYYAGGRASLETSVAIARKHLVIWRSARNELGRLIAEVRHLRPGDVLHFVYRHDGHCTYIFQAIVDTPRNPPDDLEGLDLVSGNLAAELRGAGYPPLRSGCMEVIRLRDLEVRPIPGVLHCPNGRNTLQKGIPYPV